MTSKLLLIWAAVLASLAFAGAAHADPCTAPLPSRAGATFSGVVRYVGDGDSLCVGASTAPSSWIEVRLGDFDAPELRAQDGRSARQLLRRAALGRDVQCTVMPGRSGRVLSYDRVIAVCRIGDQRIGDLLREAGGREGGN